MAKSFHSPSVSTQLSIALVGFFVIALALLVPFLKQEQNTQSQAAMGLTTGATCQARAQQMGGVGKCMSSCPSSSTAIKGLCNDAQSIRAGNLCCVVPSSPSVTKTPVLQ